VSLFDHSVSIPRLSSPLQLHIDSLGSTLPSRCRIAVNISHDCSHHINEIPGHQPVVASSRHALSTLDQCFLQDFLPFVLQLIFPNVCRTCLRAQLPMPAVLSRAWPRLDQRPHKYPVAPSSSVSTGPPRTHRHHGRSRVHGLQRHDAKILFSGV
jgi:hypothetical protein